MNAEMILNIEDLLETLQEGIEYLKLKEDFQIREDIQEGRKCIEAILEKELSFSISQRLNSGVLTDDEWVHTVKMVLDEVHNPFVMKNAFDRKFLALLIYIWNHSEEQLVERMKTELQGFKERSEQDYIGFVKYFERFPLWGELYPQLGNYETFELRAVTLKRRSYDFLWLYKRLGDSLSKRTLYAILLNWAVLDMEELILVKSIFPDYYEPDIFETNKDDVFVDVGAYVGDSVFSYVSMYGESYKRIYAYEISEDACHKFVQNTREFHDVVLRRKGVGCQSGIMYIDENNDASANRLSVDLGKKAIEIVTLDEDIDEKISFIKMDIEGAEQSALEGCRKSIEVYHPKLAICIYHGYEDVWKIPLLINEMNSEYEFYLRHNGGNSIPTEFVLLCK